MPTAKVIRKAGSTTAKKTAKTAKKPVKKNTAKEVSARFDRIEKILAETAKIHKETEKALNKAIGETEKNLNKVIGDLSNTHKETEKTLNKAIGGLGNTLGSLVEHIMTPDLPRKFKQFGFTFDRISTVKWAYGEGNVYAEIDGLLENGKQAMVVEVKTTLRRADIDDHLKRMERVRKYSDDHKDKRKFLGAMAATIVDKDARAYALSNGFFVIEPSGEDVKITKPVSEPAVW
jgi:hypothetical protein